jgi:hypothetical protein
MESKGRGVRDTRLRRYDGFSGAGAFCSNPRWGVWWQGKDDGAENRFGLFEPEFESRESALL